MCRISCGRINLGDNSRVNTQLGVTLPCSFESRPEFIFLAALPLHCHGRHCFTIVAMPNDF